MVFLLSSLFFRISPCETFFCSGLYRFHLWLIIQPPGSFGTSFPGLIRSILILSGLRTVLQIVTRSLRGPRHATVVRMQPRNNRSGIVPCSATDRTGPASSAATPRGAVRLQTDMPRVPQGVTRECNGVSRISGVSSYVTSSYPLNNGFLDRYFERAIQRANLLVF